MIIVLYFEFDNYNKKHQLSKKQKEACKYTYVPLGKFGNTQENNEQKSCNTKTEKEAIVWKSFLRVTKSDLSCSVYNIIYRKLGCSNVLDFQIVIHHDTT